MFRKVGKQDKKKVHRYNKNAIHVGLLKQSKKKYNHTFLYAPWTVECNKIPAGNVYFEANNGYSASNLLNVNV